MDEHFTTPIFRPEQRTLDALGLTSDELLNMPIKELFGLAYESGYEVDFRPDGDNHLGITVRPLLRLVRKEGASNG